MRRLSIVESLREAIAEEMRRDERVFCIGEDIGIEGGFGGAFTVTLGLEKEFGHERIIDTPISEIGIAGAAIGAAIGGMRPIADVQYSDFIFCMMDQLVNQAAKFCFMSGGSVKIPIVLRAPVGATTRGCQHAQSPESYFVHVPGLKIACPSNAYDAKGILKSAVRDDNPVLIFEHKLLYGSKGVRSEKGALSPISEVPEEEYLVPFGKAKIKRKGSDVTILANLLMVYRALEAAEKIESEGISVEVIDPVSLVPFDLETLIHSIEKTHRLIIVHEDTLRGGWGAEVAALVSEKALDVLDAPVIRVAAPDTPVPFAPIMENFYIPSSEKIIQAVHRVVG
ncbi:MAG: alpha-ketoacid dehydrogenase subunit beta [Candidatus Omnitrophota bacterium]